MGISWGLFESIVEFNYLRYLCQLANVDQWPFQEPKPEVPTICKAYVKAMQVREYSPQNVQCPHTQGPENTTMDLGKL